MSGEGVTGYPRWDGVLGRAPALPVIVEQEVRRAFYNVWSRAALIMLLAYALGSASSLYAQGAFAHTTGNFVAFLNNIRWGALATAAIMAGPILLDDARRGALELYLSRAVTRTQYLAAKVVAVFGVTLFAMLVPGLIYYGATFLVFDNHPDAWAWAWAGALGYSCMWALLVSGLGMGLSCVARSSRAATLVLLGAFVFLQVFTQGFLDPITTAPEAQLVSPFSAVGQQVEWLFQIDPPFKFPYWYGLIEWGALTVGAWSLVAWRHPRIRGEDA